MIISKASEITGVIIAPYYEHTILWTVAAIINNYFPACRYSLIADRYVLKKSLIAIIVGLFEYKQIQLCFSLRLLFRFCCLKWKYRNSIILYVLTVGFALYVY